MRKRIKRQFSIDPIRRIGAKSESNDFNNNR